MVSNMIFSKVVLMAKSFPALFAKAARSIKNVVSDPLWQRLSRFDPLWTFTHEEPNDKGQYLENELSPGESGCKADVKLGGLQPVMYLLWIEMVDVYKELGFPCIITSALDGTHMQNSLHYSGRALDFRTRMLSARQHQDLIQKTKRRVKALAEDYNKNRTKGKIRFDVVAHSSHMHIEADDA